VYAYTALFDKEDGDGRYRALPVKLLSQIADVDQLRTVGAVVPCFDKSSYHQFVFAHIFLKTSRPLTVEYLPDAGDSR
jgi:hypothetical protein